VGRAIDYRPPFAGNLACGILHEGGVKMLNTIRAIVREGKIELLEEVEIPEGTEVLITPLIDEANYWLRASES
jgi:hypothetical protein